MDRKRLHEHKLNNSLQSLLLATLAGLLGLLAWIIGGGGFVVFALVAVVVLYLTNPAASPRMVALLYPGRVLLRTHPETGERIARLMELVPRRLPAAGGPLGDDGSGLFEALLDGRARPAIRRPRQHLIGLWY
jgi:hypothetical protein